MKVNPRARQFARPAPSRDPPPKTLEEIAGPVNIDAAVTELPGPTPWRCTVLICLHKPGWWLSKHGVINCLNCCPPSSPELVVRQGTDADAPIVTIHQSRIPLDWTPPTAPAPAKKPAKTPRKNAPKRVAP